MATTTAAKPTTTPPPPTTTIRPQQQQKQRIEDILSYPILLSDQIIHAVTLSCSFKFECSEVGKQADRLRQMLRSAARLATSSVGFYDRPLRRIAAEASKALSKSLALVRKCRRRYRLLRLVSAADFRKILALLESSVADMRWVLTVLESPGGVVLTLPPIACNDPIMSWVWSFVAVLHSGSLQDKVEAANSLVSLARDNDRNKQIIVEEGGVLPLLKLLKDGGGSVDAQVAGAGALYCLANDAERVRVILSELGAPVVVQVLGDSPMRVQVAVASLVARMAEHCSHAQEDFAREHVIRPLVTLLSFDMVDELNVGPGKPSIHTVVQINKEMGKRSLYKPGSGSSLSIRYPEGNGNYRGYYKKERENERPEVKLSLKVSCARALWMLARGSVANSKRITETKGLLCLAKLVGTEVEELRYNCLMAIVEITAAAESNADLRRATFKTNSPAAKAVVDQLLKVIKDSENPSLQIGAIRAIGSLARTFPARESRVISSLVEQLGHRNQDVATEAAVSLGNFACPENFLCVEHSKSIIELSGVPPLMRLLRANERAQLHGLILVCYLAINAGKSEDLERAGVVNAFEGLDRVFVAQHPELRELIQQAIYHLSVFHQSHSGMLAQRELLAP